MRKLCLTAATLIALAAPTFGQYAYDEDFETGFTVGDWDGQGGWGITASTTVSDAEIVQTGALAGTFSGQLNANAEINFIGNFTAPYTVGFGAVSALINIDNQTSEFAMGVQAGSGGVIITRLVFRGGGAIEVLQVTPGTMTAFFGVATDTWTANTPFTISVESLASGQLRIYKDGALIFDGRSIPADIQGGNAADGTIDEVIVETRTDNVVGTMRIDNIIDGVAGGGLPTPTPPIPTASPTPTIPPTATPTVTPTVTPIPPTATFTATPTVTLTPTPTEFVPATATSADGGGDGAGGGCAACGSAGIVPVIALAFGLLLIRSRRR